MLLLVANARLYKDDAGRYYSDGIYSNSFFRRYVTVFGRIGFVAKIKYGEIDAVLSDKELIDISELEIVELPDFTSKKGLLVNLNRIVAIIKEATKRSDAFIIRMFQLEGLICWLFRGNKRYAVEMINNVKTTSRYSALIKRIFIKIQKQIINGADAVFYVTEYALQKDFPYLGVGIQGACSDIELSENLIRDPKTYNNTIDGKEISMVLVANSISGNSKGHFTVLDIISRLKKKGLNATCSFIGQGPSVGEIEDKARDMGIEDHIDFLGYINDKVRLIELIRKKDVFIFPTQSEGMPRCIIEACAAGLPCLASAVGGIPELIPPEYLFSPEDADGFAEALERLCGSSRELTQMSEYNVNIAKEYVNTRLNDKRRSLYLQFQRMRES